MEDALPTEIAVEIAGWVWAGVGLYGIVGVVFAVAFVTRGASRMDHAAKGAPWAFRLMILPGAAALWPLLLRKWTRVGKLRDTEKHQ
jgi:hypothetical protein